MVRRRASSIQGFIHSIEQDPDHHLTGPFLPQTPLGGSTPERVASPAFRKPSIRPISPWLRWAVEPRTSLKVLTIPLIPYIVWELASPALPRYLGQSTLRNPFAPFITISHRIPTSTSDDPRYQKGWYDPLFVAYYIVFFSLFRQLITINLSHPIARYYGLNKKKLDRFGEQVYAVVYFTITFAWGCRIMSQLPTWWFRTEGFWIDYPHWDMKPDLKRYYLMQMAYWFQQLLVLILGLEKPRKDYRELVMHHIVTIWLVGWSYLMNLTFIGNAVFMSMDISDAFLVFSKILNYLRFQRAKLVSLGIFMIVWTYFRHLLNLYILWSVWFEYDLTPESSKIWSWQNGTYLTWWMKYQIFIPLALLQLLNLFWYYFMLRILVRAIKTFDADDDRSDDEDEGEDDEGMKEKDD